ncbi:hypothetical protein D3C77_724580 [compost metagenome]
MVVKLLKGWQIPCDHVQKIVGLTEQPLGIDYLRYVHQCGLESGNGVAIAFAQRGENDR